MDSLKKNLISRQSVTPLVAGFSGGVVSTTLLLPLDVIKVRLQVSEPSRRKTEAGPGGRVRRLGALQVCKSILRHEGVAGLYQGLTPAVIGSAVSWGGYFFLYEGFKKSLKDRKEKMGKSTELHSVDNFVLAVAAGGCMVLLTNPIWLIKTRMQLQMKKSSDAYGVKKPYTGMIDAARTIAKEEGILALYKGTVPAMALTSHGGVQFVVYEFLKKHFNYVRPKRDKSKPVLERLEKSLGFLTIGAVSKIAASTATYPLQVLKARLQQRSENLEITPEGEVRAVRREYHGVVKTVRRMWKREGITGFFRGCIPNALRVAPGSAITFVVYEAIIDMLADD